MIDFIGDIHGHADELEALLIKMNYTRKHGSYAHPERKALFVGDYIDRGPKIPETLDIVRRMVESGNAVALMGNHEYNAVCFHYEEKEGGHLRKHLIKNVLQHYQTMQQFQNKQEEYESYLEWFLTLPLFYETEQFRAVHACWDSESMGYLRTVLHNNSLTNELVHQSVVKGSKLNTAVDITLKGKEIEMPEGNFIDKDGTIRRKIRIKWWKNPLTTTCKEISIEPVKGLRETPLDITNHGNTSYYREMDKPVFFGHYWLKGNPGLYRNNICCLDYSVAKNGHLAAYQFNGEQLLDESNFVYV